MKSYPPYGSNTPKPRVASAARRWLGVAAFSALALAFQATAGDVTLTASDSSGTTSWNVPGHWDSGAAPAAGNNYFTSSYILRTPTAGSALSFAGDSLTINPGGALYDKVGTTTLTLNVFTNNGRVDNAVGGVFTLAGNMVIPASGGGMDTGSGNSSATDNRTVSVASIITGTGALTNYTSDANWPSHSTAQGTVIYTGNNTGFTGPQVIIDNTLVQVASQANLGGNPASFNPAQLLFNNGTFQPTASFSLNNPNSGISFGVSNGTFNITSGLILTNANALAGTGTMYVTNAGIFMQAGNATNFTGTIAINGGTLALAAGGSLAGSNTISVGTGGTLDVSATGMTLANGQTLAGKGTVVGTVTAGTGSTISPGGAGTVASLTVSSVALTGGATLACDFGSSISDVVTVTGNLSASGKTTVQLLSVPANGTYTLFSVAGTLGGSAANFQISALSTRTKSFALVYNTSTTPKTVQLQVTGTGSAGNLVWAGDITNGVNNIWDVATTANWTNGTSLDVYYDGDAVNFTDAGAANPPVLNVTVNPGAVKFNSTNSYTLTGTGAIAGTTTLYKGGTGGLNLNLANSYTGGTVVTNGVLQLGVVQALGNPSGSTALLTVSNTGTFDIDGQAVDATYTGAIKISGNGISAGQGAIDNTVGGLTSGGGDIGINNLVLLGNSTVSASGGNWQIGNGGAGITGNGYTLTKTGSSYLYLKAAAVNSLGGLVISGGGVLFWDHADAAGTTATITLTNGGFIDTWNPLNNFNGLTFANSIVVSDPVNGGGIIAYRAPNWTHPDYDIYNGNIVLNGPLTISNVSYAATTPPNYGRVTLNGSITGTGGLTVIGSTAYYLSSGSLYYGGNLVTLTGNNSYSGPTMVTNFVQLLTTTANQSGGSYDVVDYGTLDIAVAAGRPTIPMSSLTLESVNLGGGNLGFTRLSGMSASPVIYATNLTISSGYILPPLAGYSVGQFPLIKYGTMSGSGFSSLTLGPLPAGVNATLVNNTANNSIDLQVLSIGVLWQGTVSSDWDLGTTANWFNTASSATETYADGETLVFDDSATRYNVNIDSTVQPAGITMNATKDYTFTGTNIAGSTILVKQGSGTLTLVLSNNLFTGGTYITGGTIKLADANYVYPYGGGALNNALGTVAVANGGTLDINAVQVPNYQSYGPEGYNVFISGAGVGGAGALVNNSTNNNDNADPGYVTLTGDATVGGIGDVNVRHGVAPQLTSQSSAYTLTKVGSGQFRVRYVTAVSTNFGAINILQGIVSYESSSPLGFGDSTKPVYVGNGGGFAWGTTNTACQRPLICSNSSTIYAYNLTNDVFAGPVTLVSGNVNLNANYYEGMIFSNVISGAGGLTLQYQGYATLAASNTYTGATTVANCNAGGGSILRLIGAGSINNSASISLQGITASQALPGALDVSGRTDGTLTLVNNQTLRGDNGSYVKGSVVATAGTKIMPGGVTNIQSMTFSNNLTLQAGSTVAMDVSLDTGLTNDFIKVVGAANYSGTLQITNIGLTALTNGAAFKLFTAGSFTSNFTAVAGSPGTGLGWTFNPTNGTATVVVTMATNPTNISYSIGNGALILSWPANHLGWILQAQTNALNKGLTTTNWVDVPSSAAFTQFTNNVNSGAPAVFYRLRYPTN